jgi:hypothetical protein
VLHEQISGKVLENAITGALGAAAAEVADLLDPFDRPEPSIGSSVSIDIRTEEEQRYREDSSRQNQKGK